MKHFCILIFYFIRSLMMMCKPGGAKGMVAENLILRHQLIIIGRRHKKAPNLRFWDRLCLAFLASIINPKRLIRTAVIIKPSTLIKLHKALIKRKYSALFSAKTRRKPGPAGPSQKLINAIIDMKKHNPRFGCRRIAMQVSNMFGVSINKDVVRRILSKYHKPTSHDDGPSWLTFIGHTKDSLWPLDFFRCESVSLKTHWVMVLMGQFTRRIIGFSAHQGDLNGVAICLMFNKIISGKKPPKYLSSDNDPLFKFHRWQANLRILKVEEIKSVPHVPISHPFVERLIRICRNEVLDCSLFWTASDLQYKFNIFQDYFNEHRTHMGLNGSVPNQISENKKPNVIDIKNYHWRKHCRGLFNLPVAA